MLRSGIWEESNWSKRGLKAKRRAGQLADAHTIPAHRLTTSFRPVRYSNRFLQSHISRLSPSPESILKSSAPLPGLYKREMLLPKQADKRRSGAARGLTTSKILLAAPYFWRLYIH